jgi:hypothetical protein
VFGSSNKTQKKNEIVKLKKVVVLPVSIPQKS